MEFVVIETRSPLMVGPAMDYALAIAAGLKVHDVTQDGNIMVIRPGNIETIEPFSPTSSWECAGPLIHDYWEDICSRMDVRNHNGTPLYMMTDQPRQFLLTCMVIAHFGDEVSVPLQLTCQRTPDIDRPRGPRGL